MRAFTEKEWAIADTEHFGRPSRWQEQQSYIRVVDKGKILGVLLYSFKAGVMKIETIIVSQKQQGHGVGSELMVRAEEVARKEGLHKLFLSTGEGWNVTGFYKKLGFVQTGELKKHYLKRDWVEFSKFL